MTQLNKTLNYIANEPHICEEWISNMFGRATETFGKHASFFDTGALLVMAPPEPTRTQANLPESDTFWVLHKARVQEFVKYERDSRDFPARMFGMMWSNLSPASQLLVANSAPKTGWTTTRSNQDPVDLLKRIKVTHMIEDHPVPVIGQLNAFEALWSLRQEPGEEIVTFKARFDSAKATLTLIRHPMIPPEPLSAAKFLHQLEPRYRKHVANMIDQAAGRGIEFPATVNDAFDRISVVRAKSGPVIPPPSIMLTTNDPRKVMSSKGGARRERDNFKHDKDAKKKTGGTLFSMERGVLLAL